MADLVVEDFKDASRSKPVFKRVEKTIETIKHKTPALVDSLSVLMLIVIYFTFTGIAIIFRAPLPKEWLKIGTDLNKGRVSKMIKEISKEESKPEKSPVKIVNLQKPPQVDLLK